MAENKRSQIMIQKEERRKREEERRKGKAPFLSFLEGKG